MRRTRLRTPWRDFLVELLLGLAALGCGGGFSIGTRHSPGLQVRLMTFNIRYGTADDGPNSWVNRRQLVFRLLAESKANVIALQEALHFQLQEICQALPNYDYVGVGRDDGVQAGEHAALLYRKDQFEVRDLGTFWFSDTPEVPGSTSWGNQITRICTWALLCHRRTGTSFYVYNVHLDHVSQRSRELSAQLLVRTFARRNAPDPVVVMGDLNAAPRNEVVGFLLGRKRLPAQDGTVVANCFPPVDAYAAVHADTTGVGTYHAFTGDRSGARIDYVLVQPGIRIMKAEIDRTNSHGRYPSDHFPVVAQVIIPKARQ